MKIIINEVGYTYTFDLSVLGESQLCAGKMKDKASQPHTQFPAPAPFLLAALVQAAILAFALIIHYFIQRPACRRIYPIVCTDAV